MTQNLSISNRIVAILMVIVIPFCCCSLNVCGDINESSGSCGSCCERPAPDGSPDDSPDSGCIGCVGCTKAPINPGPQLDTFTLSLEPIVHPSQANMTFTIRITDRRFSFRKDWDKPPEDDPCTSARNLRTTVTPQV